VFVYLRLDSEALHLPRLSFITSAAQLRARRFPRPRIVFAAMSALQPQTPRALIARHPTPVPLLFFGGGDETLADGSRYNPSVISFIRDEWLYQQVKARCV